MIRVDSRVGSGELMGLFKPYGVVPQLTQLDFGDVEFEGHGPKGTCCIVFERKRISDLISSMQSGRLAGYQLPGMAGRYDYAYLLVEGIWETGPSGELIIRDHGNWRGTKSLMARSINNFVMGLALRAGMIPWRTTSPVQTVAFIVDQYRMWEKPWDQHHAHDAVYAPAQAGSFGLTFTKREISYTEKVAMQLPGIDSKARYVASHFGNIRRLANATEQEWTQVTWENEKGQERKFGTNLARKLVDAITK